MYVKKIDLLIFGFPSLFSFVFCPAAGWRSPSTLLLCTASILEVWSLNPQILKPQILKPQPSNFEASTVKIWSLNPENFEAPSLNRQILKPQASILKILKPQASNFEASSLNPQILKLQAGCAFSQPSSNCLVQSDRRMLRKLARAIWRVRDAEEGRVCDHGVGLGKCLV